MTAKDERPSGRSEADDRDRIRRPRRAGRSAGRPVVFRTRDLSDVQHDRQARRPWWVR